MVVTVYDGYFLLVVYTYASVIRGTSRYPCVAVAGTMQLKYSAIFLVPYLRYNRYTDYNNLSFEQFYIFHIKTTDYPRDIVTILSW